MEHQNLKFISKNSIDEGTQHKVLETVRKIDPSASINAHYADANFVTLSIELTRCLHEIELEKISDELGADMDNYFVEAVCEEEAQPITPQEKATEEKQRMFTEEEIKKIFRDEFKGSFKEMCNELEMKSHNRLIEKRAEMGWKFGDRFDPMKKESPMMKPYDQLPEEYKLQNGKVFEDVLDILKRYGFTISHTKIKK